ncbi:MAG: GNAT family N-acetyltransferase [Lachnospirales bacterium]
MIIRRYEESDCKEIIELFNNTVHIVNAKDYTKKQLDVWTCNANIGEWNKSFMNNYTLVALYDSKIVGFGDITETGYLDRLYVHKNYQGKGIATALCDELEKFVEYKSIKTHASITAKKFFIKKGYKIIKEQEVQRNSVFLKNYIMEKDIKID